MVAVLGESRQQNKREGATTNSAKVAVTQRHGRVVLVHFLLSQRLCLDGETETVAGAGAGAHEGTDTCIRTNR